MQDARAKPSVVSQQQVMAAELGREAGSGGAGRGESGGREEGEPLLVVQMNVLPGVVLGPDGGALGIEESSADGVIQRLEELLSSLQQQQQAQPGRGLHRSLGQATGCDHACARVPRACYQARAYSARLVAVLS